jgi:hypothetical protein
MHCPHCNLEHPANNLYCPLTGKKIPTPDVCPQCGKPIDPEWLHCAFCGQTLSQAAPAPDQQVAMAESPQPATDAGAEPIETHSRSLDQKPAADTDWYGIAAGDCRGCIRRLSDAPRFA